MWYPAWDVTDGTGTCFLAPSKTGAEVLALSQEHLHPVYYGKGPAFRLLEGDDEMGTPIELAMYGAIQFSSGEVKVYEEIESSGAVAAVCAAYGRGRVVAMGPHPESGLKDGMGGVDFGVLCHAGGIEPKAYYRASYCSAVAWLTKREARSGLPLA